MERGGKKTEACWSVQVFASLATSINLKDIFTGLWLKRFQFAQQRSADYMRSNQNFKMTQNCYNSKSYDFHYI